MYSEKKLRNINAKRLEMFNGMIRRGCSSEEISQKLQEFDVRMYEQHIRKVENDKRKYAIRQQRYLAESLMTPAKREEQRKYRAQKQEWYLNEHQRIKRAPQYKKEIMSEELKEKQCNLTREEFRLRSIFIMETLKSKFNQFCDIVSLYTF